jgi:hypothetical protein
MPNTIMLKCRYGNRYEEARVAAGQTIKPGMLITFNTSNQAIVHATAGGNPGDVAVAIEDGLIGKTITDSYAAGDLCRYILPQKGDELYMILRDGQNATTDEHLTSNGDGTLKVGVIGTDFTVGRCIEALDLSPAPNTTDGFVKVRIA